MKFITAILTIVLLVAASCKTNQMHHKLKCGKWMYQDTVNGVALKSYGKYRRGIEKKTWRYYENNILVKKEQYKHGICYVTTYHDNGAIASEGKTKLVTSANDTHWYYFDMWNFYDTTGKLIRKKRYENGQLLEDTKLN